MTITILFKSGKEVSVKCDSVDIERDRTTGRITNLHFKGIKENKIMDLDFEESDWDVNKVMDGCSEPFRLGAAKGLDIASVILDKLIEGEG